MRLVEDFASRVSIQRGFTTGGPRGESGSDMGSRGVSAQLMQEPGSFLPKAGHNHASKYSNTGFYGHRNKRAWVNQEALETRFDLLLGWPNRACLRGQPSLSWRVAKHNWLLLSLAGRPTTNKLRADLQTTKGIRPSIQV